jgi:hypothetical protein
MGKTDATAKVLVTPLAAELQAEFASGAQHALLSGVGTGVIVGNTCVGITCGACAGANLSPDVLLFPSA